MATRKGTLALNADFTEMANAIGALQGMVATVKTDRFLTPLVEATHANLANKFDHSLDMYAESFGEEENPFHHVYEWRLIGDAAGRLWRHQLKGRGSSNRFGSWAWVASKTPILKPEERADRSSDPMSEVSPRKVAMFSDRDYMFQWKAPVMEYNVPVTIRPRYSTSLYFPSPDFSGKILRAGSAYVMDPGGAYTTLAFTKYWTNWWNNTAPTIYQSTIAQEIKKGIEWSTIAAVKRGKRKATIGIHSMTFDAAAAQGAKWAANNLHKFANSQATEADWYDPEGI